MDTAGGVLQRPDSPLRHGYRSGRGHNPPGYPHRVPNPVGHPVDERFRERLADLYRQKLEAGTNVLDLMSSWVSHLPEEMGLGRVVGHGMNEEELAANERLTDFFVQDLNTKQRLSLSSEAFGAALCAVSVQYLQPPEHLQPPERVFAEVARTLQPGRTVVVSFSNRMFDQKAVRPWQEASGRERCGLVESDLEVTGLFGEAEVISESSLVPRQSASSL